MRHILIVDDHRLMREAVAAVVREVDPAARITMAGTLAQALPVAALAALDAAIIDLHLPDGSGETLLAALGRRAPPPPVLVLSASDDPREAARQIGQGAWDFCHKSAGHEALAATLRRLLTTATAWSPRQLTALRLLCAGLSNQDIGDRLGWDVAATRQEIGAIFRRLRVANRTQAARAARAAGLVG